MSLSGYEQALASAGVALSGTQFGADLRRLHPSKRSLQADHSGSQLAAMELSSAPVVRRTLAVLFTAHAIGFDLHLTDEDRAYIQWVSDVHAFFQATVDRFWGRINPDVRMLFADGDEVPPFLWATSYIPALRIPHPPNLSVAAARVRLDEGDLARLSQVWDVAHDTGAYRAAEAARDRIRRDRSLRRAMQREGAAIRARFVPSGPLTTTEESTRLRQVIASSYKDADPEVATSASAFRNYNELIQVGLACAVGFAEHADSAIPLTLDSRLPATCSISARNLQAHLTLTGSDARPAAILSPLVIQDDGPLDGIYMPTAITTHFTSDSSIFDVQAFRVQDLENAA